MSERPKGPKGGESAKSTREADEPSREKSSAATWMWSGLGVVAALGIAVAMLAGAPAASPVSESSGGERPDAVDAPAVERGAEGAPGSESTSASSSESQTPGARGGGGEGASSPEPAVLDAGAPLSKTVKVTFQVVPPVRATVRWGKENLGVIPRRATLVVERPRDSGPLDVVIRAPGFLTVHSRAYTFSDSLVDVRLTPRDKIDTLFGYRQPLPPPDAGAPLEVP